VTAAVRDTFEDFVVARGTGLIRFAYVLCGNHHLAEDLVQEVLARLHPRWSRIERDVDYPEAYARTAIVREYLSWRRRRVNSEAAVAVVPEARQPRPDRAQGQAERDELWRALSALPRSQRAVLVLRFYEDLSDAQIADVLGCGAVSTSEFVECSGIVRSGRTAVDFRPGQWRQRAMQEGTDRTQQLGLGQAHHAVVADHRDHSGHQPLLVRRLELVEDGPASL